ncbi:type I methionyl aminopeptidase [PVC group bacterium (ex Bugula neritina AB1)]|nr:type I methionyl aminopeptidase [PVC group bacterium (ex Bugula neritina AB1)]
MALNIYTDQEIEKIRKSCKITATALNLVEETIRPGMTTLDVDNIVETYIRDHGAKPAFKGYHGFPGTVCASVNEEIVHGIPSDRVLKEGDIVGIDTGAVWQGFYSDSCRTFPVGEIAKEAQDLLAVTKESLMLGIEQFYEGNHLYTLSNTVQKCVETSGYSVVKDYAGHGIGYNLHEEPEIPNFGYPGMGLKFKKGMVVAIEPMVNLGKSKTKVLKDGWTVVTEDGQLSAHFEHTVALTKKGAEILTHG